MKCKKCKRVIEDNSVYCNWCGHRQVHESREVKVPRPKQKGNTWFAQITVDGDRRYISAETEEEYYVKARAAKAGLIEIKKAAPKLSLGTAIDNFIKDNSETLSPSTLNAYQSYRKTRFQKYMSMDVSQIPWQIMVNEECVKVKPKTVTNAWRLVTPALRYAGIEPPEVNLPQCAKADKQWLDYDQIKTFCGVIKGKPYELGALLALHGLRRSELLHLAADDVDTDAGVIHVRGASVIGAGNKLVDKDTNKNKTSTRDVHIIIPRLNELIDGRNGKLITTNPTTLYGLINKLCEKNGLPKVGVHGLRHSWVSLCFHLKWDPQTVMREGGYSNLQTINNIYRHLASQDADRDISQMRRFYSQKVQKTGKCKTTQKTDKRQTTSNY